MDIKKALKEFNENRKAWADKERADRTSQNPTRDFTYISNPWGSITQMSLDHAEDDRIFLNPEHQQHLKSGWLEAQDILDWMEGKPGKVIRSEEHWNELLYICGMGAESIYYHLKHFNLHPIEFIFAPGRVQRTREGVQKVGKGFPKKMQDPKTKLLTPEMVKAVECHIKWFYKDWFEYSGGKRESVLKTWSIPRHLEYEIHGFFAALELVGLETCPGASNLPTVRENFAWWKDMLQREAQWQLICEEGLGYQPWIDNKKTLYDLDLEKHQANGEILAEE